MRPTLALLWVLSGCTASDAGAVDAIQAPIEEDPAGELTPVDARGALAASEAVLKDAQALPPAQRAKAAEPLRILTPSTSGERQETCRSSA